MNKHLYSQQVLKNQGVKIYSNNSQILQYKEKEEIYNITEFQTKYVLHKYISVSNNMIKLIEDYNDLFRMGFQISRQRVAGKFFNRQQIEYFLIKNTEGISHLGYIPQEHKIEFNFAENWIRLIGRNASGRKIYLKKAKENYKTQIRLEDFENIYEEYMQDISPFTYIEEEETKIIEEIPILLTADGTLICLPQMKDNPTIGIFGKKGRGKSLLLHRLADCVYHKWNKRILIANDGVGFQTKSWNLPWDRDKHSNFVRWLEQIGETTRPLPCVYIYPMTSDTKEIEFENEIAYKIALSFKDIMEYPNSFFEGTKDELLKSEKYLKNLIFDDNGNIRADGLVYVKSLEDIHRLINEKVWTEQTIMSGNSELIQRQQVFVIPETSRIMIYGLLKELFISKIFDITSDIPAKWLVEINEEKYPFYPWNALLFAAVVPVINTSRLRFNKYYSPYLRFILNDVFRNQSENEIIKRNKFELWCFIDEIQDMLRYKPALDSFTMINKEARNNRMGIVYATQYFGDIPEDIHLTTDYCISFAQSESKASEISKNYDLMSHQQKDLIKLKRYEAMIAGKLLVTYDTEGNREEIDDGTPFKGIIFPSVSQHSAPKEEGL